MTNNRTKQILQQLKKGQISVDQALLQLKLQPYDDLGFAKVDNHRQTMQGTSEVIFGKGKTASQILDIARTMITNGASNIIVTRIDEDTYRFLDKRLNLQYDKVAKFALINPQPQKQVGNIVVVSAGTSDLPVCEEAVLTAEALGNKVTRLYDVGVAGLHRLLSNLEVLTQARVIIVVAGMEGALASVVGGLVDCPVIAVPTSVGYGANFEGLSALLAMLNSCASGVTVVNIDNGFGAGYSASMINHMGE